MTDETGRRQRGERRAREAAAVREEPGAMTWTTRRWLGVRRSPDRAAGDGGHACAWAMRTDRISRRVLGQRADAQRTRSLNLELPRHQGFELGVPGLHHSVTTACATRRAGARLKDPIPANTAVGDVLRPAVRPALFKIASAALERAHHANAAGLGHHEQAEQEEGPGGQELGGKGLAAALYRTALSASGRRAITRAPRTAMTIRSGAGGGPDV
jgi:hypothetical protein